MRSAEAGRRDPLRPFLQGGLVCVVLVAFCYAAIDRPVASLVHGAPSPGERAILDIMARLPEALGALAVICLIACGTAALRGARLGPVWRTLFLASVSFAVADFLKTGLKFAFGRTWPETWIHANPSYIGDGTFGFFPFHGGAGWQSFPSGHTAATCAVFVTLGLVWPRLWPVWALPVAVTVVGLIGMNYHFVSDTIAGGFLGAAVAGATLRLAGPAFSARRAVSPLAAVRAG